MRNLGTSNAVSVKIVLLSVALCGAAWGCRFDKTGLPIPEPPLDCGNGVLDTGEDCDGTELGGQTCEGRGYVGGGVLACTDQCAFDVSQCQGAEDCGDGVRQDPEECDGQDLAGQDCVGLGFDSGQLACAAGCTYDTQGCVGSFCGDGVLDPGESCDLTEFGGETCLTLLHAAGELHCTLECELDESACLDVVQGWYDVAWQYRKTITIHAAQVDQDESDFPVAVLLPGDADLQAQAQGNGDDILFTSDDGTTKLSHEIEVYNGTIGALVSWVKVPSLSSSTDTVLYLYYGNASASSQQSPADVWDAHFTGVYHLDGAGVATFDDSSGAGHHASPGNFAGDQSVGGKLGPGQILDGSNQYVAIPAGATSGYDHFTYCLWVNTSESGSDGTYWQRPSLFGQSTSGYGTDDFGITTNSGTLGLWTGLENGDDDDLSSHTINDQIWHYICAVNDGDDIRLYLDDLGSVATVPSGGDVNSTGYWLAGRAGEGGGGQYHQGSFDELQISSTNRTPGWLQTSYRNQHQPLAFYAVGTEQYYLE